MGAGEGTDAQVSDTDAQGGGIEIRGCTRGSRAASVVRDRLGDGLFMRRREDVGGRAERDHGGGGGAAPSQRQPGGRGGASSGPRRIGQCSGRHRVDIQYIGKLFQSSWSPLPISNVALLTG